MTKTGSEAITVLAPRARTGKAARKQRTKSAVSASQRVYQALRQRILDLSLMPGAQLSEFDIAAEQGVSRTPVHQAVQKLADEGLVEIRQRVGTFVAKIPVNGLEEAMLVRTALEVAVVERAAKHLTEEALIRLRAILQEQNTCVATMDFRGFHVADEAFHAALADIAGFPGVWNTIQQAKIQIDRFRRLTLPISGRMEHVLVEHTAVVEALASGRGDIAAAAMREHLDHVLPVMEVTRSFRPDYFSI